RSIPTRPLVPRLRIPCEPGRAFHRENPLPLLDHYQFLLSANLFGRSYERGGPAAMFVDDFVDLSHKADGFVQGNDDLLVEGDVILRERAAFAIFEPFLANLITADVKSPNCLRNASKATRLRLVYPRSITGIRYCFH